MTLDSQATNTILAALRFYQEHGMGDPDNRSDAIHDIATGDGDDISLDDKGIDELCERLNFGDDEAVPLIEEGLDGGAWTRINGKYQSVRQENGEWVPDPTPKPAVAGKEGVMSHRSGITDHARILMAYLARLRITDIEKLKEACVRHTRATAHLGNAEQVAAITGLDEACKAAMGSVSPWGIVSLETVIKEATK